LELESLLGLISPLVEQKRILLWNSFPEGAPCVYFPNETSISSLVGEAARRGAKVIYLDLSVDENELAVRKIAFPIGGILHVLNLRGEPPVFQNHPGFRFGEFLVTAPKIDLTQYNIITDSVEHENRINGVLNRIPQHLRRSAVNSVFHNSFIGYQVISRISNPLLSEWSDDELNNHSNDLRDLHLEIVGKKRNRRLERLASELIDTFDLDFSSDLLERISLALRNIPDSLIDSSINAVKDPNFIQHRNNVGLPSLKEWSTSDLIQYQNRLNPLYSALIGEHLEIEAKKIASRLIQDSSWDPLFSQNELANWLSRFSRDYELSKLHELVSREIRAYATSSGREKLAIDEIRSRSEKLLSEMRLDERDKFASYSSKNDSLRLEILRQNLGSQYSQTYLNHLNRELRVLDELIYRPARDKRFAFVVTTLFDRGDTKTSISTTLGIPLSKINRLLSLFPDPEDLEAGDYLQDFL
jgi:hypothetical protein